MRAHLQASPKIHTKLRKVQAIAEAKGEDSLKEPQRQHSFSLRLRQLPSTARQEKAVMFLSKSQ